MSADRITTDSPKQGSDVTVTFTCDIDGQQGVLECALLPNDDYPCNEGPRRHAVFRV